MLSGVPSVGAPDILPRYEHTELAAQRRSPVSNVSPVQQVKGEDAPPAVTLTKTHSGHLAKLHTVGENLDKNLTITDRNGQVQAGVGIRFQEERNYGIYVAGLTPKGPADASGKIQEADILISVDGYNIQQHDRIETVRKLVLGPPASIVTMTFERRPKTGDYHTYTVQLRRSGESQVKKRPAFEPGFVGLMVSPDLPHAVSAVHDLVDINGVVQGAPGYQNERVDAGDFIVSINNQDAQRLSVDDLHELLRGELHSAVEIVLQRKRTKAVYTVKVLRHRKNEYSEPPVVNERTLHSQSASPYRAKPVQILGEEVERMHAALQLNLNGEPPLESRSQQVPGRSSISSSMPEQPRQHADEEAILFAGWNQEIDQAGKPYRVNHNNTQEWSWDDPTLEVYGKPLSLPREQMQFAPPSLFPVPPQLAEPPPGSAPRPSQTEPPHNRLHDLEQSQAGAPKNANITLTLDLDFASIGPPGSDARQAFIKV